MTKRFKVPFAVQGDTAQIPDTVQTDGKVSYNQGFGHDYEKAYSDPQAKDIGREQLNGLFKDITEAVGEIQLQGVASHVSGETYPKGSIVYFGSDLYISNIANNKDAPPKNWTSIKSIADDSLKKNSNLSDLKDVVIARKNLNLGDAATLGKTSVLGNSEVLLLTQKAGNDISEKLDVVDKKLKPITEGGTGATTVVDARKNLDLKSAATLDKTDVFGTSTNLVATQALVDKLQKEMHKVTEAPVDQIFIFENGTAPSGFITRSGQIIDKAKMPKLFSRYGERMPDDRDRAMRMSGNLTPGVGETQEDAMQKIEGQFGIIASGQGFFSGAFNRGAAGNIAATNAATSGTDTLIAFDSSRVTRTAEETRVKARIVIFCNKIQ